jgi:hypothetical protein
MPNVIPGQSPGLKSNRRNYNRGTICPANIRTPSCRDRYSRATST